MIKQSLNPEPSNFVRTVTAKLIENLISRVQAFSDAEARIGVIIGDAGSGKSAGLRAYAEANENTVYVSHCSADRISGLLAAIARKLTGKGSDGSLEVVSLRLIEAMQHRRYVVLIDESSSLRAKDLDRLRTLICVRCCCPLVLAGNADLLRTLGGDYTRTNFACLDQFNSRMIGVLNLDEIAAGGGSPLYPADDIRKLFEYGGIKLTGDAVKTLVRICQTPQSGRLRTCSHIIRALHTAAVVQKETKIDARLIAAAVRELRLPVADRLPLAQWEKSAGSQTVTAAVG